MSLYPLVSEFLSENNEEKFKSILKYADKLSVPGKIEEFSTVTGQIRMNDTYHVNKFNRNYTELSNL